jgi:nitronate monooxygenase
MSGSPRLGDIAPRLSVPLIAAPMFQNSGVDLVIAACRAGAIGAFPTSNCRSLDELDAWLGQIMEGLAPDVDGRRPAPACANLIIRQARLEGDLERLVRHRVEMVITSVGSPAGVVKPLHEVGCQVYADVASIKHAEKAVAAGADGLILLTAGAGGQTGWANPFAFVRAVRSFFDGPLVMAGGISDGAALWAARVLGCDLGYMGTLMLATRESMAKQAYKEALLAGELDDVMTTKAFSGLDTNMLRPSIIAAGLDPDRLNEMVTAKDARETFGAAAEGPKRWSDIWSAGHSVSGVRDIPDVATLVRRTRDEYEAARQASRDLA